MNHDDGAFPSITVSGSDELLRSEVTSWALGRVRDAARGRGSGVRIEVAATDGAAPAESYSAELEPDGDGGLRLAVTAADPVGAAYALTEFAARLTAAGEHGEVPAPWSETARPAVPVRGIMRSFSSVHEDSVWFHDREFWTEYLDFLAEQRFNRFHLAFGMQYNYGADKNGGTDNYLCFVYPFLFDVDGWSVRAEGVDAAERRRNLDALKFIARETKRRGMSFQLGLWNHAYDYGRNSEHWYPILGVSDETHAAYSAAGMKKLLAEVPEIDGLTFRVHYEGGIHDDGHEVFWGTVFQAISEAGRPLEVDMHAKGVDQPLLDAVAKPGIAPVLSGKYWAEHMGLPYHQTSIRAREAAQPMREGHSMNGITEFTRRFTRYGYGDFLSEDRSIDFMFRVWPGTQKLLLWGDPAIAAGYGRYSTFGGSRGVDFCEPLFFKGRKGSGVADRRDPYVRDDLRLGGREWRKYRYTYLLWGRLLYQPDENPEVWQRFLAAEYGEGAAAAAAESALASLGRILPLLTVVHGVGGSNNGYWPEVAVNLPISAWVHSEHYDFDTPDPKNWGGVSPFDPTMFYGVNEYVADALAGTVGARYTPLEVAAWIDDFVAEGTHSLAVLRETTDAADPQVARTLIDLEVLVRLGRFFAGKFRTAVDYAVFEATGHPGAIVSAVKSYEQARAAWLEILDVVDGVYQDDLKFGVEYSEHGHWAMRVKDIDDDLRALRLERDRAVARAGDAGSGTPSAAPAAPVAHRAARPDLTASVTHRPPVSFHRGDPLRILIEPVPDARIASATLRYRHVDQSESFRSAPMTATEAGFEATIDGDYTDSPYPLMYFVELTPPGGAPVIYPGFTATLANQPYLVVSSDRHSTSTPQDNA